MTHTFQGVSEREKGQYPISIATSLALEGAAGIHPDNVVEPPPFNDPPRELWINIRTLFRNMMGAMSSDNRKVVLPRDLHMGLMEELTIIEQVVTQLSQGRTITVFYGCDYTALPRKYPKAQLKQANTPNQRDYLGTEQQTLRLLMGDHGSQELRHFDTELTGKHGASWIITHLPLDLLSRSHFESLKLLESHTGTLKGPALWYTKFTGGKDLPQIPFSAFGLQVFGDGGHQFNQMPIAIRQEVLRLAEEYKWNATTTRDRLLYCIRTIQDPMTRSWLLALV